MSDIQCSIAALIKLITCRVRTKQQVHVKLHVINIGMCFRYNVDVFNNFKEFVRVDGRQEWPQTFHYKYD